LGTGGTSIERGQCSVLAKILIKSNADLDVTISLADPDCRGRSYKNPEDKTRSWSVLDVFKRVFTKDQVARLEETKTYMRRTKSHRTPATVSSEPTSDLDPHLHPVVFAFLFVPWSAFREKAAVPDQRVTELSDD